jgi:hypothetical protein
MVEGKQNREHNERRHEEYLELCALSASGNVDAAQHVKLQEHLELCAECREAQEDFDSVVDHVVPMLASDFAGEPILDASFSEERAEASFRKRLTDERKRERNEAEGDSWLSALAVRCSRDFRQQLNKYDLWLPAAASVLLCFTLGILSYRTGRHHGIEWARLEVRRNQTTQAVSADSRVVASQSTDRPDNALVALDAALADLRRELAQKSRQFEKLKALASSQQVALRTSTDDNNGITEERDRLLQQVSAEEETLRATQERLTNLEQERSEYVIHTASLETTVADLSRSLEERQRLTTEQQDLLAKDRDIRELIGARDLYITEIYDVAHNGDNRKAAGRVFYTKGKSLVFYAYDLNESPGMKDASAFEAWGQRGPDWHQASKIGIFYEDNASKKRWVAKSNDRNTLEQIDAVFITVEPRGGSDRPTGKPLLFAYLRTAPNHP